MKFTWKNFPENPLSHAPKLQNLKKVWKNFPGYLLSHAPLFGKIFRDLPIWVKEPWHLWCHLHIEFEYSRTEVSIQRGRPRCQQYLGYSDYFLTSQLLTRWSIWFTGAFLAELRLWWRYLTLVNPGYSAQVLRGLQTNHFFSFPMIFLLRIWQNKRITSC